MLLEIKFTDSTTITLEDVKWSNAHFDSDFLIVKNEGNTILCAPKESVIYYRALEVK